MEKLINNQNIKLLLIFIVLDTIFGILRAIKEGKINSTIGIDGIIRKVGMIITIIVCVIVDSMISFNLIGFLPKGLLEYLPIKSIGIASFFNVLYIAFEILSIMKNMYKCELPIPKKLQGVLKSILKDFTSEIKEEA